MKTFTVGQIIKTSYMPNSDMPVIEKIEDSFEILSRTKCFVTVKNLYNEKIKKCKVKSWDGCKSETAYFDDWTELTA